MKNWLPLLLLGFGVALAIVIGQRMSTDAMAVVIGVAVGVSASVPTSLLLVALLRRERQSHRETPNETMPYGPYPPMLPPGGQPNVIVIDPSQYADQRYRGGYPLPPAQPPAASANGGVRSLRVVGSNDDDWGAG